MSAGKGKKIGSKPSADWMEKWADDLEEYAHDENRTGRMVSPLFADSRVNGATDAPGWCLKQARKWRKLAAKKRKNYEHKRRQKD